MFENSPQRQHLTINCLYYFFHRRRQLLGYWCRKRSQHGIAAHAGPHFVLPLFRVAYVRVPAGAELFTIVNPRELELAANIPSAIVMVIQGIIILTLAGAAFWMERKRSSK